MNMALPLHAGNRLFPACEAPKFSYLKGSILVTGDCRRKNRSSNQSSSNGSSSTVAAVARFKPRSTVVAFAWFKSQVDQSLWDYTGSNVKQISLQELQLLHRLSFGHRNQRSYLIVLYQVDSPACQALETEVERLASGLRHEPAFVAAALEVSGHEAAAFASKMLGVSRVPAVLLYPEAARGCLKFLGPDMSAVGMLAAINKARQKALPATPTSLGAPEWRLIEAATPLTVTSLRAAAASGDTETVVAALQQQMVPIQPTPLAMQQPSAYWNQGRAMFWGGLLLCSMAFLAWDLKLSDAWEDWCLARRQTARARGRKFTAQENIDDLVTLMMHSLTASTKQQLAGMLQRHQDQPPDQKDKQLQPQQVQQQPNAAQSFVQETPDQDAQGRNLHSAEQQEVVLEKQGAGWALRNKDS